MEQYSDTTRFALACNSSSSVIEPIQSRCAILRFRKLDDTQVKRTAGLSQNECKTVQEVKRQMTHAYTPVCALDVFFRSVSVSVFLPS